jgi:hypothetical protein
VASGITSLTYRTYRAVLRFGRALSLPISLLTFFLKRRAIVGLLTLQVECDTDKVSDGYHTFGELYEHRCLLFIALMRAYHAYAWRAVLHADGTAFDDWFIAGMNLPTGAVTYHLPQKLWPLLDEAGVRTMGSAPEWDGHTSKDVVARLRLWLDAPLRAREVNNS